MVVNSLNEFSGDNTSTTTTLTPTTLKHITQIFESEDCLKSLQTFEQSGFVPPPPPQQQPQQFNIKQRGVNNNFYCGGTTTVVTPIKEEPLATLLPKIENEFSDYSENSIFDEDYDEEYQPAAKKTMQTRNGGVKRSNSRKEPVQRKRKGNMKDDYDGLPPSERNRLIMRRERNKQAAARCRQRREDLTKSLMLEVKHWEGKKDELEDEIRMLRSQKEELEHILSQHNATCGFMSQQTVQQIVAVKSEPGVIVESVDAPYAIQEPKRHRPSSLTLPFTSYIEQDGPDGVLIETPSTVIPSFDNFMTSTGLTPVVTSISTPMFYSSCGSLNTPVSCAYQQRSREVPDLNTPGETVSLVSL